MVVLINTLHFHKLDMTKTLFAELQNPKNIILWYNKKIKKIKYLTFMSNTVLLCVLDVVYPCLLCNLCYCLLLIDAYLLMLIS